MVGTHFYGRHVFQYLFIWYNVCDIDIMTLIDPVLLDVPLDVT